MNEAWRKFEALGERLAAVRNPAHHEALKARVRAPDGRILMLRSNAAVQGRYPNTAAIEAAALNPESCARDFCEEGQQAREDIQETLVTLNGLWETAWKICGTGWRTLLEAEVSPFRPELVPSAFAPGFTSPREFGLSAVIPSTTSIVASVSLDVGVTYTSTLYPSS